MAQVDAIVDGRGRGPAERHSHYVEDRAAVADLTLAPDRAKSADDRRDGTGGHVLREDHACSCRAARVDCLACRLPVALVSTDHKLPGGQLRGDARRPG